MSKKQRILDARASVDGDGDGNVRVYFFPNTPANATPEQAAVMLSACATRPCYWDGEEFTTFEKDPELTEGLPRDHREIRAWELKVVPGITPATNEPNEFVRIRFYLALASQEELRRTSGLPDHDTVWHELPVSDKNAPIILEILKSKYSTISAGEIRNSDIW